MKTLRPFRLVLYIACFIYSIHSASAQYNPSKVGKKAVEAYNKGLDNAQGDKYKEAIDFFQDAIKKEPGYVDAYLSLAGVYGQLKDHEKSIATYERSFSLDSNYTSDFRLPYSINLAALGQFDKALNAINALLSRPALGENTRKAAEYRRKTYQFAVDYAMEHPAGTYIFKPVNLGDNINSSEAEYFPSMPIDGSGLVFTRRLNDFNEDFFFSENNNGSFGPARRLTGSINTPQNEGAQVISQDGQWLVFTACNRPDGQGSCDIYISYKTPQGWSEAVNMGNKVNSEQWDSQPCLSPDKRDLYFSSHRTGGLGGSDIYVCHLQPNGRWSEPENLGPEINTSGNEFSPFMHADNQSLYFTSTGWPGYGKEDLFVSKKGADGKWGTPLNLGYPINTVNEEGSLFIMADGKTAYYASDRADGKGKLDIYSFELRPDLRPAKTLWVKGKVYDKKTSAGLPSSVELIDLASKRTISKVQTDETGNYLITLPVGKDYAFNVARRGYLFYSDNFSLANRAPDSTYNKDIPLQPIEVNATVVLKNIFFDFNKFDLEPQSQAELDKVVQLLQENPTVKIQLEGHTDNVGNAADNLKLSENRAKSVVNYLVTKGIDPKRLSAKGFGATQPVAVNTSEEGRAQNRRTELKIVGK